MSDPTDANATMQGPDSTPAAEPSRPQESARPEGESWFDRLLTAVGLKSPSLRHELEEALEEGGDDEAFTPDERALLTNVLGLHEQRVADIMVPRADMYALPVDATLNEVLAEFRESGHSRMPVYRGTLDDPVGMVHIKDVVAYMARAATVASADGGEARLDLSCIDLSLTVAKANLIRKVLFVPSTMPVATLLTLMKNSRLQLAIVVDEYGGTDGLVSIEDAIETIVGEIEDEHDEDEPDIVAEGGGVFVADAGASIEDVAAAIGGDIDKSGDGDEIETIGGKIFSLLGRIPAAGEVVALPGYSVEILDADPRRIRRIRLRQVQEPDPTTLAPQAASRG